MLLLLCAQGIYVLQDNNFRWLVRVTPAVTLPDGTNRSEYLAAAAQPYLELPCGIIRGEEGNSWKLSQASQRGHNSI